MHVECWKASAATVSPKAASSCSTAPPRAGSTRFSSAAARSTARPTSTWSASATIPQTDVRWPGSFGSAYLYFLVPRVILFREEHTRRVFVPKVDFVSAPGVSDHGIHRPGGPHALVTQLACFSFDKERARFRLESVHPGHTLADILANTGFEFDHDTEPAITAMPDAETLSVIRGPVAREIARSYPKFAARVFPDSTI